MEGHSGLLCLEKFSFCSSIPVVDFDEWSGTNLGIKNTLTIDLLLLDQLKCLRELVQAANHGQVLVTAK